MFLGKFLQVLATILRVLSIGFVALILMVIVWIAWRAAQPMDLSEFNGLTYYQFLEWRSMANHDLAAKYQASHPNAKVKMGMCEQVSRTLDFTVAPLQTWLYTFEAWRNDQNRLEMLKTNFPAPDKPVSTWNFLPSWWRAYEKDIWSSIAYSPEASVAYCRIQPDVPTPAELKAMQQSSQEVSGTQ